MQSNSKLTRDQLEEMLIDAEIQDGRIHKNILDHDAAQRQRIAQLEAEVNEFREKYVHQDLLFAEQDRVMELGKDRDEWKRAAQLNNGIYEPLQRKIVDLEAEVAGLNGIVASLKQSEMYWVGEAEKYSAEAVRLREELNDL